MGKLATQTGRLDDLVIAKPGAPWRFKFLDYEARREGLGAGLTVNIVHLLTQIVNSIEREEKTEGEKPFWKNAFRHLITASVDLALFAGLPLRLDLLGDIVRSGPKSSRETDDRFWQTQSVCYQCIAEGDKRHRTADEEPDYRRCREYWFEDFATLAGETRSSIIVSFTMLTSMFTPALCATCYRLKRRSRQRRPSITKLILIDMPLQEHFQAGRICHFVWKCMWQKAVLRRKVHDNTPPIFLWCDESQNLISDFDPKLQAVARSARALHGLPHSEHQPLQESHGHRLGRCGRRIPWQPAVQDHSPEFLGRDKYLVRRPAGEGAVCQGDDRQQP